MYHLITSLTAERTTLQIKSPPALCFQLNQDFPEHSYVTQMDSTTSKLQPTLPVSLSLKHFSMLPYRNTFVPISDGEKSVLVHKLEKNPEQQKYLNPKKTASKRKTKAKSKTSKKENVHCDSVNAQTVKSSRKSTKKKKEEIKTKPITDYFPSQRSKRKTSVVIKKEKLKEFEEFILSGKEEGFEVQELIGKGRGVITTKKVCRGDFVLEYCGELISTEEAKKRELNYATNENVGCYMYYFTHGNKQYCVDATKETTRLGRLVNHSKKGSNLKTKTFVIEETPHLILVADRDIFPGEELLYDYGDRSKRSLQYYPWLAT